MQIRIDSLSHDGRGIGRVAGKVAFVPGALPGEVVEANLARHHRRYDEYRLLHVIESTGQRVVPPCPIADRCGGCDLQHLAPDARRRHEERLVLELLERQAGLVPESTEPPLTSPPFGYRRRARLAVHVPRRGRPLLGFRESGGNRVVDIEHCMVLMPAIASLPGELQHAVARLRRPRDLGHVELVVAEGPGGAAQPMIHVRVLNEPGEHDAAVLRDLAEAHDAWLSVQAGDRPPVFLRRPTEAAPAYHLPEFDVRIEFAPGDFLQSNGAVNRKLVSLVSAWLGEGRSQRLLDAFCGLGNLGLPLARRGWRVAGLEADAGMVRRAQANAALNGLDQVEVHRHDLHEGVPALDGFDAAVLDPPRAGAQRLVAGLASAAVPVILYVSCSPPTLARDAAILSGAGYVLSRSVLVDMFPQTSHVEVMALFAR